MTGHQLEVVGEQNTLIRIGSNDLQGRVIVAPSCPYELVIGKDMMKILGDVSFNFKKRTVTINGEVLKMEQDQKPAGVYLCQNIRIPSKSKAIVMGMCYGLTPDVLQKNETCYFRPTENLLEKYDVISQDALVNPDEKLVPIKIMNFENVAKYLPEKATLGTVEMLKSEEIEQVDAQDTSIPRKIRCHTPRNKEEIEELLKQAKISEKLCDQDKDKFTKRYSPEVIMIWEKLR